MLDVILQLWDLGGQERFEFMKQQFFTGASAVALCYDLSREESFLKLGKFVSEVRQIAGDIPILLVGNKRDLEEDVGEIISQEQVHQWMQQYGVNQHVKTSAKTGANVDYAFNTLSKMAFKSLENGPKPGQYGKDDIFRFKIVMYGAAGVGKTSLIHRFARNMFASDYKLTVGVDFLTKKLDYDESALSEGIRQKIHELRDSYTKAEGSNQLLSPISPKSPPEMPPAPAPPSGPPSGASYDITPSNAPVKEIPRQAAPPQKQPIELKKMIVESEEEYEEKEDIYIEEQDKEEGTPGSSDILYDDSDFSSFIEKDSFESFEKKDRTSSAVDQPVNKSERYDSEKKSIVNGMDEELDFDLVDAIGKSTDDSKQTRSPIPKPSIKKKAKGGTKARRRESFSPKSEMRIDEISNEVTIEDISSTTPSMTEQKLLHRKTSVFYRKQMNPLTLNKLSVVLSTEKIYESLKEKIVDADRAASGKRLEIKEISPFIQVEPYFPGCVTVPAMIPLDAREESAIADFKVTPLATGDMEDACVRLYYEGKIIDEIPTPTKVVKQTAAKMSGALTAIMPIFGPLFDSRISSYLSSWIPFNLWDTLGGIEGFFLILGGLSAVFTGLFYMIKKPRDAKPVESNFPALKKFLDKNDKN